MSERAGSIKRGYVLDHNNKMWIVVSAVHIKPGKGGAYMQVELKEIGSGLKKNERFRADEVISRIRLDDKKYVYLFSDGKGYVNMVDCETHEQIEVSEDKIDKKEYLQDGMELNVVFHDDEVIFVNVPSRVTLQIQETSEYIKGQTVTSSYKPATLENGVKVNVPPFIKSGDYVVVNTADDTYYERSKEGK